ncbi:MULTISPECIES: hypothetical protein [Limosilactobacillus]|uniref:hypothetical protein n=1 Tax=Limosilactobacillus TaxID=2742598 RepID=UPI001F59FF35|nr:MULTISPECIES: hypothetical protein [Limosilactobacillus]MCW4387098.1 hypothetical protein [Limosilactobacillus oris]
MDIMTMILTNQPIHYLGQKWQATKSFDDGDVELINDNDEIRYIKKDKLMEVVNNG